MMDDFIKGILNGIGKYIGEHSVSKFFLSIPALITFCLSLVFKLDIYVIIILVLCVLSIWLNIYFMVLYRNLKNNVSLSSNNIVCYDNQEAAKSDIIESIQNSDTITVLGVGGKHIIGDESPLYKALSGDRNPRISVFLLKSGENLKSYCERYKKSDSIATYEATRMDLLNSIQNSSGSYHNASFSIFEYDIFPLWRLYITKSCVFVSSFASTTSERSKGYNLKIYKIPNDHDLYKAFQKWIEILQQYSNKIT